MHQLAPIKIKNSNSKFFLMIIIGLSLAVGALLGYTFLSEKEIELRPIAPVPALIPENLEIKEELYAINFFASWCKACIAEHKNLIKLHNITGIPFYGIAVNDSEENIKLMMSKYYNPYKKISLNFPIIGLNDIRLERIPRFLIIYKNNIIYDHTGEINDRIMTKKIIPTFKKVEQLKYYTGKEQVSDKNL